MLTSNIHTSKKLLAATSHRPNSSRQRRLSHQPNQGPIAGWSHNHTLAAAAAGPVGASDFSFEIVFVFWFTIIGIPGKLWIARKLYSEYEENSNIVTVNEYLETQLFIGWKKVTTCWRYNDLMKSELPLCAGWLIGIWSRPIIIPRKPGKYYTPLNNPTNTVSFLNWFQ